MRHRYTAGSNNFSLRILFCILSVLISLSHVNAQRWKYHPAIDNNPVRIIDTERYTFFQVLQKWYSRTATTYDTPVATILLYDKTTPSTGIIPAAERFGLTGGSVRACDYSQKGKFLAVLYAEGDMDIVSDSGGVINATALKDCYKPGWSSVNSMTVSGTELWIATPGGYAVVDGTTGRTSVIVDLHEDIKWIARCGDRIIAFTADRMFETPGRSFPRKFSEFKEIVIPSAPGNPKMLMPRKDGAFLYLANPKASGNYSLNLARLADGQWTHRALRDLQVPAVSAEAVITHPFEKNFVRNKYGWMFFTGSDICQIYMDADPASGEIVTVTPAVVKDNGEQARSLTVAGSWDGRSCWTYQDRGRFSKGEAVEGRFLIDDANSLRPNLPAVSHATHIVYAKGYGTLAINYGCSWNFMSLINNLPPLLSAYKDGKWSLPNPAYNMPASAQADPGLATLYRNNLFRFPVSNPTGITVDPVNPDYVWLGSSFSGIAALNLAKPGSDPIHLGSPVDPLASYPGFKAIFENVTGWSGYTPASAPSFDADGNLWTAYHYVDGAVSGDTPARLYYWPRENREKVLKSGDVSQIQGIGFMKIPCDEQINAAVKCLATTHPEKRNMVFMYITPYPRYLARLNHNGTLDDQSDDKIDLIYSVEDQHGALWPIDYCHSIVEESSTGLIWIGEEHTLLCFDPASEVKNGVIKGMVPDVEYDGVKGNPFSFVNCSGITFDDSRRLWCTTGGLGIWCISADRKRVEAHYTASNSGLPHDTAYGIAWNPETRSLMISTNEGLVELWSELPSDFNVSHVAVYPNEVTPDFTGPVTVRGAEPGERITVETTEGAGIAQITAGSDGIARWNLTGRDNRDVKNGFYILKGSFGNLQIAVTR